MTPQNFKDILAARTKKNQVSWELYQSSKFTKGITTEKVIAIDAKKINASIMK